jgi:hypothetical protein
VTGDDFIDYVNAHKGEPILNADGTPWRPGSSEWAKSRTWVYGEALPASDLNAYLIKRAGDEVDQ